MSGPKASDTLTVDPLPTLIVPTSAPIETVEKSEEELLVSMKATARNIYRTIEQMTEIDNTSLPHVLSLCLNYLTHIDTNKFFAKVVSLNCFTVRY